VSAVHSTRWLILGVPAALYFVSYFHRVAPAVVATDLMRAFSIPATTLGHLATVYPYVFAAMALVAGSLADTLGPRRTLALGGTAMGAGAILFGMAPVFGIAFAGRLLVGLGASVILIAWLSLAAEWTRAEEFATLSGLTQSVGTAGALVAASPLAVLVAHAGWRQTFVMIGIATVALALVALLLVRDTPAALGLPSVSGRAPRAATSLRDVARAIPAVVGNRRTWPPILAATGIYAGLLSLLGLWGMPYLTQVHGLDRVAAANLMALLAIGMGLGSPLVGWVSDRWLGRRRVPMAIFTGAYTLCWLPLVVPPAELSPALLGMLFVAMGLTSSGLTLVWSCVREVNDPTRVGIAIGFCNMPIFFGFAVLQWLTGVILDSRWTGTQDAGVRVYSAAAYEAAFSVCLITSIGALVMACLVTETRCRNVWRAGMGPVSQA
jgi:sugar phosphate permease